MDNNVDAELDLIKTRIEYYTKYKYLLEKKKETMNGLIVFYKTSKHESDFQQLQYAYEAVKLEIDEFEIDTEIASKDQFIEEFLSRQQDHTRLQAMADEVMANMQDILQDADAIMRNPAVPPQQKDILKSMINGISSADFQSEKQSIKNRALINFKMQIDNLKAHSPSKIKLVR